LEAERGEKLAISSRHETFFSHHERYIGERLPLLRAEDTKVRIKRKKHLDTQALHHGETGRIDVAKVLIVVVPCDLTGLA
jgi:hypothetical protein